MASEQLPSRFYKSLFTLADDMRDRAGERREFSNSWRITVQQLRLLRTVERLTRTRNPEGVMLKSLAETLNVTPAAVSGMVETMVKRDYLERTQAEDDRRSVRIKLSKYCCERILVLDRFFQSLSEKIAEHMPEDEFRKLVESMEKLSADFEAIIPPQSEKN
jgi:DNA-binding MarR family transcriptional regulator